MTALEWNPGERIVATNPARTNSHIMASTLPTRTTRVRCEKLLIPHRKNVRRIRISAISSGQGVERTSDTVLSEDRTSRENRARVKSTRCSPSRERSEGRIGEAKSRFGTPNFRGMNSATRRRRKEMTLS